MGLEPLPSKERFRRGGLWGLSEALPFCTALFAAVNVRILPKSHTIALSPIDPSNTGLSLAISVCETFGHFANNGLAKNEPREVRSGEGATLARDGFAVPSTGRVQQHEQMEAPRGSRVLGAPSRS